MQLQLLSLLCALSVLVETRGWLLTDQSGYSPSDRTSLTPGLRVAARSAAHYDSHRDRHLQEQIMENKLDKLRDYLRLIKELERQAAGADENNDAHNNDKRANEASVDDRQGAESLARYFGLRALRSKA